MTISIHNNTISLAAQKNLQKASVDLERAIARMSSGKASAFPGDRVAESAIATTLSSNIEMQKVALTTAAQAGQSIEIAYAATEEQLGILGQLSSIAAQTSSDTMSDVERKSMDRQFSSLRDLIDLIAEQANYNGTTMLTGDYSGASHIQTSQSVSKMVYDITRPDQYITHGVVGENPVLERNTTVKVVDKIGKDKASGFIEFSENLKTGDKIVINGRTFTAADVTTSSSEIKEDEFKLGCCLKETLQNLVKVLNMSTFSEVTPAHYRIEDTQEVDPCDPNADNVAKGPCDPDALPGPNAVRLVVEYNMSGTIGNEFTIGTALAAPIDKAYTASLGSLRFDSNLIAGDKILVGGVEMIATESAVEANKNDKNFLIGDSLKKTMESLADKLNNSRISELAKAKYTAMSNGISVEYAKKGYEGNKFTIGAITKATDANTITTDQIQVLKAGTEAKAVVKFAGVIAADDTITIDGVTFTAVAADADADATKQEFKGGDDAAAILETLKAAVEKYVEDNSDSKLSNIELSATGAGLTIEYKGEKGQESQGNGIEVKAEVAANVQINGQPEEASATASGELKDGVDEINSGTGVVPKAVIIFSTAETDKAYKDGDTIELNGTEFKFVAKATPGTTDNEVVFSGDSAKGTTLDVQMQALVEKFNSLQDTEGARKAKLDYFAQKDDKDVDTEGKSTLVITYNKEGAEGNDYYFLLSSGTEGIKYGLDGKDAESPLAGAKVTIKDVVEAKPSSDPVPEGSGAKFGEKGSQLGVDKKTVVSKISINDTYFTTSSGQAITDTLNGGESDAVGRKATLIVDYDTETNYAASDKVKFGSIEYTFEEAPAEGTAPDPSKLYVGKDLAESMRNLIDKVNNDTKNNEGNPNGKIKLSYNEDTHLLTIVNDVDSTKNKEEGGKPVILLDGASVKTTLQTGGQGYDNKTFEKLKAASAPENATPQAEDSEVENTPTADDGPTLEMAIAAGNIEGTHAGEDRKILKNTNKVNINNTGESIPENGIAAGTLINGTDLNTGKYASVKIDFSKGSTNFADGDMITLNGETFTFRVNTITDASGNQSTLPLSQTAVDIGDSIDDALNNLAKVVNTSKNKASNAMLQYDKNTHELLIKSKTTGSVANDYSFNFGGTKEGVLYDIGNGSTSEDKITTIRDVASKNVDFGTMGTEDIATLFPQNMRGDISELKAVFKPGIVGKGSDEFTSNSVQFFIRVNGETYQTGDITLSGGNKKGNVSDGHGYRNLGNFIAGCTRLYFQRVGGDPSEAGFTLTIKEDGITLKADSSPEEVQKELNNLMAGATHAIKTGGLSIGVGIKGREVKSYGLSNIDQFIGSGAATKGSYLAGSVEIYGTTGLTKAQGVIEFKNNNFQNGDYLMVNGTKVIADQDFSIGRTIDETVSNIVSALNKSNDNNIAQAFYSKSDDGRLVITYKQAGDIGNSFKVSANFVDRCGNGGDGEPIDICDPNANVDSDKINGVKINGNSEFLSSTNDVSLGEKDPAVNDKYVVLGANKKNVDDIMPSYLIGGISDLKIELIDGYSSSDDVNTFTPNSLKFSTVINCSAYTGQIDLSGGNRGNGVVDGKGYNGLGNFLAGGSKIILNSMDGTHSIALTLDESGIKLPGLPDGKTNKTDVLRELSKIELAINNGLKNVVVNQKRQVSSFDASRTSSTVLRGVKAENVYFQSPDFDENGKGGLISSFKVDNTISRIYVTIGDRVYSQDLGRSEEEGGLGSGYDSINKVIKGGIDTTIKLTTEDDTNDARALIINLQGVADIDISADEGAKSLEQALNSAFGASDSSGLRFQIGTKPTDLITLTFPDVRSKALFRDDDGQYVDINVSTRENAMNAAKIIHNAVDKLRQERAAIGATQAQFESVSNNLRTSIRALQASRAVLEDADIAEVSAEYAMHAMKMNAASTAFAHGISSLRDMISRILQM